MHDNGLVLHTENLQMGDNDSWWEIWKCGCPHFSSMAVTIQRHDIPISIQTPWSTSIEVNT